MRPLDASKDQEVAYCIPMWQRDEQIKHALARPEVGRIAPAYDKRPEPCAIVGYGPSLNDTWEQIRGFTYIVSCSGAHKFLIERGIIPTWHVEVDPREHKVPLLGLPHPDVTYLPSSTCHPKYFDHLKAHHAKVQLWHVYDSTADGTRLLPHGEWAITGGCDVGLRSITIAGFLGFRDLHIFGLDGCARDSVKHAGPHPNPVKKYNPCEYDGVTYYTTAGLLQSARQVWHELDQMPAVTAKFYGEGLIQHMAKNHQRKAVETEQPFTNCVAFSKPELISTEYRRLNTELHHSNLGYGVGGARHASVVKKLTESMKTTSVLDYGCGKGYLAKELPFPIWEYDPAIPAKSESPRPADLVVCTDVLEHIEPDRLDYVLDDLRRVTRKVGYFVIHTGPAAKTLADGRNTHLIQQGKAWWEARLGKFFRVAKVFEKGPELRAVVGPKPAQRKAA